MGQKSRCIRDHTMLGVEVGELLGVGGACEQRYQGTQKMLRMLLYAHLHLLVHLEAHLDVYL